MNNLAGKAFDVGNGVFVFGDGNTPAAGIMANTQGNVSMIDMASQLPDAQFQASDGMPMAHSFASTSVAADFYNTAKDYSSANPGSEKLMVNSPNRDDGALFSPHTNSHTGAKPAIDVAYHNSSGINLSGHGASKAADTGRARSLLATAGGYGFTRTVTNIQGIGSFQILANHDNHIHLGE